MSGLVSPDTARLLESQKFQSGNDVRNGKKTPLIRLGKCAKCSVACIYIIGIMLAFNSLLLFVFGVIFKVNPNLDRFKTFTLVDPAVTPSTPIQNMKFTYATSPIDIMALFATFFGGYLFFIGLSSVIGACLRHKCLLGAMIGFSCIILILSFAGLFFTMAYATDEVTRLLNSMSATGLSGYGSVTAVTESIDFMQYYFNCCGIQTSTDMYSGNLAQSCCSANVTQDSTWLGNVLSVTIPKISSTSACTSTTKPSCYSVFITWTKPLTIAMIVYYLLMQVFILVFLIFLFQGLKGKNRVAPIAFTNKEPTSHKISISTSRSRSKRSKSRSRSRSQYF